MKLTLIRHAKVEESYIGKYNGHNDIGLSKEGLLQAKKLAKKVQEKRFDKVYCSDLTRAKETLKAFNLKSETIFTQEIREKSWGVHEGMSFEEIEETGIKYKNFNQWIEALDGERTREYRERIKKYFYEVIAKDEAKNILVVTHAGVIKMLLSIHNKLSLEEAFAIKLDYASFIELELN